jgi:hypothetical protein
MPPTVTKQSPPSKPRASSNGSVLSGAIPVGRIETDFLKVLLYGINRVGKTTFACQFPKPLLLISCEPVKKSGGAKSVKKFDGVTYLKIQNKNQMVHLAEELAVSRKSNWVYDAGKKLWIERKDSAGNPIFDGEPFATDVIDTVTSLQDIVLTEILGHKSPEQLDFGIISTDQYRERSSRTKEVLRPFLDLDANTVIIGQEKDHNPPKAERNHLIRKRTDESFFSANAGSGTVEWLRDACDYIVQLYMDKEIVERTEQNRLPGGKLGELKTILVETGKQVRRLRTSKDMNYDGGFRSETPENVPEYIEATTSKEMFDGFMMAVKGLKIQEKKTTA